MMLVQQAVSALSSSKLRCRAVSNVSHATLHELLKNMQRQKFPESMQKIKMPMKDLQGKGI